MLRLIKKFKSYKKIHEIFLLIYLYINFEFQIDHKEKKRSYNNEKNN